VKKLEPAIEELKANLRRSVRVARRLTGRSIKGSVYFGSHPPIARAIWKCPQTWVAAPTKAVAGEKFVEAAANSHASPLID
jgi:hypothetical protein